ncbi:MAG: cysteine desulfurase [Gemmatimonadales bacterium]|nr:cysteine desulfurase [Gemmatimonadales bacterium]
MNNSPADPVIYLDYNATTPLDPRVAEAMLPFLERFFGNPSSSHAQGRAMRAAVDKARSQAAGLLGAEPEGIIFTSGGTEANNHAILGAAVSRAHRGRHIVTSAVEHPAVNAVCHHLESLGFTTSYVPVDRMGRVDPEAVAKALTEETILVTLMHANNEVGTLQPVAEVARLARARGILTHSDCAQSVGKVPVTLDLLGVDMISVAGHKLYAPKGVGILCLGKGVELPPLMHGADHEAGRRPGTENILGIVGLGQACQLAEQELLQEESHLVDLRDRLQTGLLAAFPNSRVHGDPINRLPNTLSIGFPGAAAWEIMDNLPGVAVSAGAACHDGKTVGSQVLRAMGVDSDFARGTLRISVGRMTTEAEIQPALAAIVKAVKISQK